ncbi:MAG: hypothetical protein FWE27_01320 [Defluviitaleaceae bacterium]|nr:hypothetical protein [Defluviitaleaceae bacterium]
MINKALFTEQLKRFWAVPALAALMYLLFVYANIVGADRHDDWWAMQQLVNVISMRHEWMLYIMLLTPVITAFCVFGCFFNKRSAAVFYSFPLNKNQLFITNTFAGIILSLIPVIIFCAVLLFPLEFSFDPSQHMRGEVSAVRPSAGYVPIADYKEMFGIPIGLFPGNSIESTVINSFPVVASLFLRMVITTVFYFGVAWLAFSLAGHGIIALLIVGVMPFVWGTLIRRNVFNHTQAVLIPAMIYIVLAVAIFVGAYFVSRNRKPENTGNSVMFAPVKNVLVFMVSAVAMFILGLLFYSMSESFLMMYVGFVIGFAIGYIIAQMIAEKSFYILDKIKHFPYFFGTAAAIYLFIFIFTQYGIGFYVNRIPPQENISAVHVTNGWFFGGLSNEDFRMMANNDPEFIAATQQVHQTILNGRSYLQDVPNLNSGNRYTRTLNGVIHTRETLFIKYILQNGQAVTRQYSLPGTFIEEKGLSTFLDGEGVVLSPFPALRMPEALDSISLMFDFSAWDEERERWIYSDTENIVITDRAQMGTVLDLIAISAVEKPRICGQTRICKISTDGLRKNNSNHV